MKPIIYVAHPVSTGDPVENAYKAIRWVKWFIAQDSSRIYVAPWVAEVLGFAGEKSDANSYQRVLDDDCEVVGVLHGVVGTGGEGWTKGMAQERATARARHQPVLDLTGFREPEDVPLTVANDLDLAWAKVTPNSPDYVEPY